MTKTELVAMLTEVKRQRNAGVITDGQYADFMTAAQDKLMYFGLTDPVWEKPVRAITPPRAHKAHRAVLRY